MTDPEGWHVGDLEPPLAGTATGKVRSDYPDLTDAEFNVLEPVPVDLSTATATVANIRRADGTVITRAVTLGDQTTDPGTWSLPWVIGDLSCAGGFSSELEATWPGARPQTFGPATFQVARQIA